MTYLFKAVLRPFEYIQEARKDILIMLAIGGGKWFWQRR